jgi:hypothetical protein
MPPVGASIPPPAATYDREIELSFWTSVKDSKSPAMLQNYLDRYPYGNFAGLARTMLDELQAAANPPAVAEPPQGPKTGSTKAGPPAVKGKSATPPARRMRKATRRKADGDGMCWGVDGSLNVLVPCSDTRARTRAY